MSGLAGPAGPGGVWLGVGKRSVSQSPEKASSSTRSMMSSREKRGPRVGLVVLEVEVAG